MSRYGVAIKIGFRSYHRLDQVGIYPVPEADDLNMLIVCIGVDAEMLGEAKSTVGVCKGKLCLLYENTAALGCRHVRKTHGTQTIHTFVNSRIHTDMTKTQNSNRNDNTYGSVCLSH
jgi:hypothetical protein